MAKVSHVATIVAPSSMLLQIFAACPLPASPAWMTVLPMADKIGLARSNALSVPPTMKVNVPPAAAAIPPETGASTISKPFSTAAAITLRAVATSMVEDRKSTRLNSITNAHLVCRLLLEKKKKRNNTDDNKQLTHHIN